MTRQQIHFVTGRLAEHSLQTTLAELAPRAGFQFTVGVLPITVAAMMRTPWVSRRLEVPPGTTKVVLPGYCQGDLEIVTEAAGVPVERGPSELRNLPEFFGVGRPAVSLDEYDIEIIAEINHCPRLTPDEIDSQADRLRSAGADVIDVGCEPNEIWHGVGPCVERLVAQGHRVSVDSLSPGEIEPAIAAGAQIVLSVNSSNIDAAVQWDAELVVIPDDPRTLAGLDETIDRLARAGRRVRVDPILEPIGIGFAESLWRYAEVRRRYPDVELMMGIGNLTEMSDCDSAAANLLLLGFCQELGVRSVLTTQVINWARTSVRECDIARRIVHAAHRMKVPPKRIDSQLIMLRDDRLAPLTSGELGQMADTLTDHHYRVFAAEEACHLVSGSLHLADADPFLLFQKLLDRNPNNIDVTHAFYLGYELAKAKTALTLGKNYQQDQSLDWGYLTEAEAVHRLRPQRHSREPSNRKMHPPDAGPPHREDPRD